MAMECAAFGFAANLMQLTGTNPVQLIRLIWDSAQYANVHKRNCRQFADNLQRMGNLLDPIKDSEYLQAEAVQEPLRKLKELLFFGFILVDSCENKNKFIVFALTWWKRIPKKFSDMENQIRGLILTCVTLINTNLHINTHSETAAKLDRILEWMRRMENGKYVDETQVSGAEAVALQGQHQLLIQGLQREKHEWTRCCMRNRYRTGCRRHLVHFRAPDPFHLLFRDPNPRTALRRHRSISPSPRAGTATLSGTPTSTTTGTGSRPTLGMHMAMQPPRISLTPAHFPPDQLQATTTTT